MSHFQQILFFFNVCGNPTWGYLGNPKHTPLQPYAPFVPQSLPWLATIHAVILAPDILALVDLISATSDDLS